MSRRFEREKTQSSAPEPLSVLTDANSPLTEAFRAVRTNLHFLGVDSPHRKIVVASAVAKEGKTTTAANLGLTMALSGAKTLLIDADLRRPALHRFFQLSSKVGLTSVLGGRDEIHQAIQETKLADLFVLPCGPLVANPTELLGSRRMAELVSSLQQQYDLLVFDSPPVVTVADTLVLAGLSDGVILVIRSGGASHEVVSRAMKQLEGVRAKILGAVLNAFDFRREAYYSSYSYYYYSGYGYGQADADGDKSNE
jgi:capsular exopolysaccharide synthesis family protein